MENLQLVQGPRDRERETDKRNSIDYLIHWNIRMEQVALEFL